MFGGDTYGGLCDPLGDAIGRGIEWLCYGGIAAFLLLELATAALVIVVVCGREARRAAKLRRLAP